jgi:hypothetical protein
LTGGEVIADLFENSQGSDVLSLHSFS